MDTSNYSEYEFEELPQEIKEYISQINTEIVGCVNCQPYDNEEKDIVWIQGDQHYIDEYLSENEIPEEYWDIIISHMECPECGKVFENRYDEVGIMSQYEAEYQRKYGEIVTKTREPIQSFYNFLAKYPYLGLSHDVGQEILKEIKSMQLIVVNDVLYYRARKLDDGMVFEHNDMLNPSPEKTIPEGRFNHFGQSHWYLGNSEALCAHEISGRDKEKELLWMQKIKIKQLLNVLDVSVFIDEDNIDGIPLFFSGMFHSGIINVKKSKEISWTPEYFIPRFISDIARLNEINGIIYDSSVFYGSNLVIFDKNKAQYEFENKPYIYTFDRNFYKDLF
jgi:hypothetical protein